MSCSIPGLIDSSNGAARSKHATRTGHTYERAAIERWLESNQTSPLTGALLASRELKPNHALRKSIEEWRAKFFNELQRSQLEIHEPAIAVGSFKSVYRGEFTWPGSSRSMKVAVLKIRSGDAIAEANTLLRIGRHPHLVRYIGVCKEADLPLLVTEFAPMGSLADAMERIESQMTPAHQMAILQQIGSAMQALSEEKMVHRDLALRNVLLFSFIAADVTKTLVKVRLRHWHTNTSLPPLPPPAHTYVRVYTRLHAHTH